jgi:hypothetical protein
MAPGRHLTGSDEEQISLSPPSGSKCAESRPIATTARGLRGLRLDPRLSFRLCCRTVRNGGQDAPKAVFGAAPKRWLASSCRRRYSRNGLVPPCRPFALLGPSISQPAKSITGLTRQFDDRIGWYLARLVAAPIVSGFGLHIAVLRRSVARRGRRVRHAVSIPASPRSSSRPRLAVSS